MHLGTSVWAWVPARLSDPLGRRHLGVSSGRRSPAPVLRVCHPEIPLLPRLHSGSAVFETGLAPVASQGGCSRGRAALCRPRAYEYTVCGCPLQVLSGAGTMLAEHNADVAQLVEHRIRNAEVSGSIPDVGSQFFYRCGTGATVYSLSAAVCG